jgi:hypothetical protein
MMGKARTKAAFDFQCPQENLSVTKIDNGAYGVRGCDQQATCIGKDTHYCLPLIRTQKNKKGKNREDRKPY